MIVVDASAVIEFLVNGPKQVAVAGRLRAARHLAAPQLLDAEVGQVLRRLTAAGLMTPATALASLVDLANLPMVRYPHVPLLRRAFALRGNATFYDALYLALAEAIDAPLLTCDRALAKVKQCSAQVWAV
ncbi:MAG: type II toxin-antitoxin system VapC family toxin [Myxococcales bacterium]|nr:type II toxin-antitoxin system VapC family toxin [Myxococcales bacterium]